MKQLWILAQRNASASAQHTIIGKIIDGICHAVFLGVEPVLHLSDNDYAHQLFQIHSHKKRYQVLNSLFDNFPKNSSTVLDTLVKSYQSNTQPDWEDAEANQVLELLQLLDRQKGYMGFPKMAETYCMMAQQLADAGKLSDKWAQQFNLVLSNHAKQYSHDDDIRALSEDQNAVIKEQIILPMNLRDRALTSVIVIGLILISGYYFGIQNIRTGFLASIEFAQIVTPVVLWGLFRITHYQNTRNALIICLMVSLGIFVNGHRAYYVHEQQRVGQITMDVEVERVFESEAAAYRWFLQQEMNSQGGFWDHLAWHAKKGALSVEKTMLYGGYMDIFRQGPTLWVHWALQPMFLCSLAYFVALTNLVGLMRQEFDKKRRSRK